MEHFGNFASKTRKSYLYSDLKIANFTDHLLWDWSRGFGVCGATGLPAQNRTYSCQINKDLYEILSSTTAAKNTKRQQTVISNVYTDPMKCCPSSDCSFVLAFKAVSLGTMWWNLMPFFARFKLIRHLATTKMIININWMTFLLQ